MLNHAMTQTSEASHRERALKTLAMSDRQIQKLSNLIGDLLDVSRVSSGQLALHKSSVNLSTEIKDLMERIGAAAKVQAEIEESVCGLWDSVRVEQVMMNLLTNAKKYGKGKPIHLRVWQNEQNAFVSITDQGLGIEPEHQTRIFDRFARAVSADNFGGFGLGLYISKEIVQAHQGSIEVHSQLGKGSTSTVRLPKNLA
jgi:signal transduction histidine kinase